MNRIDQAIREALLESYLYLESCGEMTIPDRETYNRKFEKIQKKCQWFRREEVRKKGFFWQEIDHAYPLEPHKELFWIYLENYFWTIQMNELQKMRAE